MPGQGASPRRSLAALIEQAKAHNPNGRISTYCHNLRCHSRRRDLPLVGYNPRCWWCGSPLTVESIEAGGFVWVGRRRFPATPMRRMPWIIDSDCRCYDCRSLRRDLERRRQQQPRRGRPVGQRGGQIIGNVG